VRTSPCSDSPDESPFIIERDVTLQNTGTGNLVICELVYLFNPRNAAGKRIFWSPYRSLALAPGETLQLKIFANLTIEDAGHAFYGQIRIMHNAGAPLDITLDARVERLDMIQGNGVSGGINRHLIDSLCLNVDWDFIQKHHFDHFIEPELFDRLTGYLNGRNCCPPPASPACQCIDWLEVRVEDGTPNFGLKLLKQSATGGFFETAHSNGPILYAPFQPESSYALALDVIGGQPNKSNMVHLRRWVLNQTDIYNSDVPIFDVVGMGRRFFLTTKMGVFVLGVSTKGRLTLVTQLKELDWGTRLGRFNQRTLALIGDSQTVFYQVNANGTLKETAKLDSQVFGGSVVLPNADLLGTYAFAVRPQSVQIFDLKDLNSPKLVKEIDSVISTSTGLVTGNWLILYNEKEMAIFDIRDMNKVKYYGRQLFDNEVRHLAAIGPRLFAIGSSNDVSVFGLDHKSQLRQEGHLSAENWLKPFLPATGGFASARNRMAVVTGNGLILRLLRLESNTLDETRLKQDFWDGIS